MREQIQKESAKIEKETTKKGDNASADKKKSETKPESVNVKFVKRNVGDAVNNARARYLARKMNRAPVAAPVEEDD